MSSADMRTQTPAVTATPPLAVSSIVAVYPDHASAGAVRVGQALGRGEPAAGRAASGITILLAWNRKADALARGEFALAGAGAGVGAEP